MLRWAMGCGRAGELVGEAVREVGRKWPWRHVAVHVELAGARAEPVGQRIGHGHESNAAAFYAQRASVQLGDELRDGLGAAGLVAVYGAQYKQARTGRQAVVAQGSKVKGL